MTARREASAPPHLPGYTYVRVLGLGGFADVFLYEQELPRREVAVKVLLAGSLDDQVRTRFQTEANLMAQLSHHPSIVTIHQAAIASDGRPYLVMEYCSRPGLAERYRQERISVAEALRIGIRLSSAVETAHRAGILHRDIKPANVLTTDFGWPALTDFGIAATTGHGGSATVGMSIPWSPPELLGDRPTGDERSDVYSLGATIYSLLAGRTPFELPGSPNGAADLVGRIERMPLPPTGRDDVPPDLHDVLVRAMEKHPSRRLPSAAAVARALQQVEAGLRLPATPLDLLDEPPAPPSPAWPNLAPGGDEATRLRSIVSVDPLGASPSATEDATRVRPVVQVDPAGARVPTADQASAAAGAPAPSGQAGPDVVLLAPPPPSPQRTRAPRSRRRAVGAAVSGAVVLLAAVAIVLANRAGGQSPLPPQDDFSDGASSTRGVESVPSPSSISGERRSDGTVVFTWQNPDPEPGDAYLWGVLTLTGEPALELVETDTVTVPADQAGGEVCIEVSIVRADRRASAEPAQGCVP
ncbi:serine/threonine-protein kinase [Cellulomonas soli]|uniref:serine/threonine-protein kinase n=1 Tax=Cellulomonas soli TaxID=931535 RepID=UPI003F8494F0